MRVPEEPVCVHLFRQKPVFTFLHLKSPVHVHRLRGGRANFFFNPQILGLIPLSQIFSPQTANYANFYN